MPSKTIITCDICGESGKAYPSSFKLAENFNIGDMKKVKGTKNAYEFALRKFEPLNYMSPNWTVYLCKEHYESMINTLREWYDGTRDTESV